MRFKWLNLLVNRYEIILYLLGEWLKKTTEEPGERNTLPSYQGLKTLSGLENGCGKFQSVGSEYEAGYL